MSRHFPAIEELTEWKNEYTGKMSRPADGAEGERQGTFSQNSQGISRRNEFFNPKPIKIVRQEEEQVAEMIPREELKRTFKFHAPQNAVRTAETTQYAEPEKPLDIKRPTHFATNKVGQNVEKVPVKQALEMQSAQEHSATLKNPLQADFQLKKTGSLQNALSHKDSNFKSDFVSTSEIRGSATRSANANHDRVRFDDLVVEILSHKVGDSRLAQSCAQLAMKMAMETRATAEQFTGEVVAGSADVDFTSTDTLNVEGTPKLSSDIVYALKRSKRDWKNDDLEQMRTGSWAMEIASRNLGPVTIESLKPDALKAMGRLVMQSLILASASQKHDVSLLQDTENVDFDRVVFKEKVNQIANLKDLMKEESFRQDLQALQDGLLLEKSADEVLESFLETLRDEVVDAETAKSRRDILIGNQASAQIDKPFIDEIDLSEKVIQKTIDKLGGKGKVHFKQDAETSLQSRDTFDKSASEVVTASDKVYIQPKRGFAIMEVDAEQSSVERREEYT